MIKTISLAFSMGIMAGYLATIFKVKEPWNAIIALIVSIIVHYMVISI